VGGGDFVSMLGALTLGNIGTSGFTCGNINVGLNEKKFNLNCQFGTMREIHEFGLQKIDNQTCSTQQGMFLGENDMWDDL